MARHPASAQPPAHDIEELRFNFERSLMEADRMIMQTVQTSVSLIGFGFTINTFFNDVAGQVGASSGGAGARILGMTLLAIGLFLLTFGTWAQAKYRRELRRRYPPPASAAAAWGGLTARFTPSFVCAVLLMIAGLFTLGSALLRWLI
jgi:putative membrane protein